MADLELGMLAEDHNDNSKLAEDLDLAECAKWCPAFDGLNRFVLGLFNARQN
jgi:hypothetical protein